MSVPLVFLPVRVDGMLLVDGEVTEPVPVHLARRLGGKVIVAVDVYGSGMVHVREDGKVNGRGLVHDLRSAMRGEPWPGRGDSALEVVAATYETMSRAVAQPALAEADVVISPEVHDRASFEMRQAETIIAAGEVAALEVLDELRRKARRPAEARV
jgi:NTE family protein